MSRKILAIHVGFAAALAIVADLAWATGIGTKAPWFSPSVSLTIYGVSLPMSLFLVVVLAASASSWAAHLEETLGVVDERVAALRSGSATEARLEVPPSRSLDEDMDEVLESLLLSVEDTRTPVLSPSSAQRRTEALVDSVSLHVALRAARLRVWWNVAGPIAASGAVMIISGTMLPGAEGFAEAHYQLNTALVLFLGYGWWILGAWAVATLRLLRVGPTLPSPRRRRPAEP